MLVLKIRCFNLYYMDLKNIPVQFYSVQAGKVLSLEIRILYSILVLALQL